MVTWDLKPSLGALRGFDRINEGVLARTRQRLEQALRTALPHDTPLEFIDYSELKKGISDLLAEERKSGLPVISLDRLYIDNSEFNLSISRLTNPRTGEKGLGPREGRSVSLRELGVEQEQPTIDQQLDEIASDLKQRGKKEAIIADVGIFSGESLIGIMDRFKERGIKIKSIVSGLSVREGVDNLKKYGVDVKSVRVYEAVHDWLEARDFFPGVPASGRIAGQPVWGTSEYRVIESEPRVKRLSHAIEVITRTPYSLPYIFPFGDPVGWASLPKESANEVSRVCLEESIGIHKMLEEENGRPVTVRDLIGAKRQTGLPTGMKIPYNVDRNQPVLEILKRAKKDEVSECCK